MRRSRGLIAPWLLAGGLGWAGLAWLGWTLWQQTPPRAGFDLALLLEAARDVLAGVSPYDPAMLAGQSPAAPELFYSYPPPVAQAMVLLAWLPDGVVLVLWALGATAGLGLIAWRLARRAGTDADARGAALRAVLVAPLVLPFAVALLFGNVDAWYPLAYGALLLAVLPGASPRAQLAGGIAIAVVAVAKLHPGVLVLWLVGRALAERGGASGRALAAMAATGIVIVGASLVVGGSGPWLDYAMVVRAGAGAGLVDPRNVGPVSLLGQVTGLDAAALRWAQVVVAIAAAAACLLAGLRVRDPLASASIAFLTSLVVLPVTWYHYPVALIPIGLALAIGRPGSRSRVALAVVIADVAIAFTPLLWAGAIVLVDAAMRAARRERSVGDAA